MRLQRASGNRAVGRFLNANDGFVQRKVRIGGGATKVDEAAYLTGAKKGKGSKYLIEHLINDPTRRVFQDEAELESYADGGVDHVGMVTTKSAGSYWYRLPKDRLTILGESHNNPAGNVENVITGLNTSRFIYEPFHDLPTVDATAYTKTSQKMGEMNTSGSSVSPLVDAKKFDPAMENIVIKALTGTSILRNKFAASNPGSMNAKKQRGWRGKTATHPYTLGERAAFYTAMAIRIAQDNFTKTFGKKDPAESDFHKGGRALKKFYSDNKAVLDGFQQRKDANPDIGIYELIEPGNFKNLPVFVEFSKVFHEYGSRYIEKLGDQSGSSALEGLGQQLAGDQGASYSDMDGPINLAREEIMWQKIQAAKGTYLLAGMGDAHRTHMKKKIEADGIPHEEVVASLERQEREIDAKWVD